MRRIRSMDTLPEMAARKVHELGYLYRTYAIDQPGKPDLVFLARRYILMIHGCFRDGHKALPRVSDAGRESAVLGRQTGKH